MLAQTFLSIVAACVGFVSALFFAKGTILMTEKDINKVASSGWGGFSRGMADSITAQRADYTAGALLLVLSFSLQIVANLVPPALQPELLKPLGPLGCAVALIFVLLACAVLLGLAIRRFFLRARSPQPQQVEQEK